MSAGAFFVITSLFFIYNIYRIKKYWDEKDKHFSFTPHDPQFFIRIPRENEKKSDVICRGCKEKTWDMICTLTRDGFFCEKCWRQRTYPPAGAV